MLLACLRSAAPASPWRAGHLNMYTLNMNMIVGEFHDKKVLYTHRVMYGSGQHQNCVNECECSCRTWKLTDAQVNTAGTCS